MLDLAKLSEDERSDLFRTASVATGMQPAIIEKDFWVCYTLDHLFQRSAFKDYIVFKGGTSLSKAFGLISRFSEDIDLILDWRLLGYRLNEPWDPRSNTQQDKFKLESIERTNEYLATEFVPELRSALSEELGSEANVYAADEEETVIFEYPRIHYLSATLDVIRLEIGPLAAWTPTVQAKITPYVAEVKSEVLQEILTLVTTVTPERTFWEKATILHQEANRPESKKMPLRYARHYYDVFRLGNSPVKNGALADTDLLKRVVDFKTRFYRAPWAMLENAKPGSFKLAPPEFRLPELRADYTAMQDMLTGNRPTLDEILEYLQQLEDEINSLD